MRIEIRQQLNPVVPQQPDPTKTKGTVLITDPALIKAIVVYIKDYDKTNKDDKKT